jgi:hypothetical protein
VADVGDSTGPGVLEGDIWSMEKLDVMLWREDEKRVNLRFQSYCGSRSWAVRVVAH